MPENLTGKFIKDTYKKVLQVGEDGNMYDGTGSLYIPRSASHEINHEVSSSYAETSSFSVNAVTASCASTNATFPAFAISASDTIQGLNIIGASAVAGDTIIASTQLKAPGFTASSKLLQLGSSDNKRQELIVYGKIQSKGSDITLMSGSLTASTNVNAPEGIFGTGTTTINDNVTSTGTISAGTSLIAPGFTASNKLLQLGASDNRRQELVVYGKIQQKGSDLTIMSGSLTASADISCSTTIKALSGSFGTGTTTITDKIHTTGEIYATKDITSGKGVIAAQAIESQLEFRAPGFTASERRLTLGAPDNERQELIVHGKLQVKGSDITFMSGSITASTDISCSGNISSGDGGTGSFDHIITLDDTIEFRNKDNKGEIKGFVKFDPVNGLVPKDKDKADILRLADRVPYSGLTGTVPTWNQNTTGKANTAGTADKAIILNTARTIDGVSFDGSRNILTNQHMGMLDTQKILIGDFEYNSNLRVTVAQKTISLVNVGASAVTVRAFVQIPVGRTLAAVTPYGDPTPAGTKTFNAVDFIPMTVDGAYGTALAFEGGKGKSTPALLNRLGTRYAVSALTMYRSTDTNFMMISLTLNPDTGFSSLVLNYS